MGAKNIVIAGDYFNYRIGWAKGLVYIEDSKGYNIEDISKSNVEHYEIVTEESIKSATSAISRGLVGGALLGGLLIGLAEKFEGNSLIERKSIEGEFYNEDGDHHEK